jgi:hypothetical protein
MKKIARKKSNMNAVAGVTVVMAALVLITATLLSNSRGTSVSLQSPNPAKAQYNCELTYAISTPTPTPTSKCSVSYDLGSDQAVCWMNPKQIAITYHVNSLPTTGGPYYVQTNWYIAAPTIGPMHYSDTTLAVVGAQGTVYAQWPGVTTYNPIPNVVEVHAGLNIVDAKKNPVVPDCTGGIDYYWTPLICPAQ